MYDLKPVINVSDEKKVVTGFEAIAEHLVNQLPEDVSIAVEVYPGVTLETVNRLVEGLRPSLVVEAERLFVDAERINEILQPDITDDRIFGRKTLRTFEQLQDEHATAQIAKQFAETKGRRVIWGTGASLLETDLVIYADISRWETILRYRTTDYSNWMADNAEEDPVRKIKRAYFVEWVLADKRKKALDFQFAYYIDMHDDEAPKLITGEELRDGLAKTVEGPFRLVPFFDPGVWGGSWMQEKFQVGQDEMNLAWSFDGVPEENSIRLGFGEDFIEIPAINLVFAEPEALLGRRVYGRFGAEFPIRFDFLDTMDGQNLSLQVHPVTGYIQDVFGMHYTQDESYYIIDAKPGAVVYAGLKNGIDKDAFIRDLYRAEKGEISFPAEDYVHTIPIKAHDHISYPGGTIHCSGADSVVLEISSTPNRFTFKLWDWDRVDFDGLPRPINLEHGLKNIDWSRDADFVHDELFNKIEVLEEGENYRREKTGLHELEFIETVRYWFSGPVSFKANGSVKMLNFIQGDTAIVYSPTEAFAPYEIHFGETFIVPAAVGDFMIRPAKDRPDETYGIIEASVR